MKHLGPRKPRQSSHTSPWRFDFIAIVAAVIAWFALFILHETSAVDDSILLFATLFVAAAVALFSFKPGSPNSTYFFSNPELPPSVVDEWARSLIDRPKHDPIERRSVSRTERWLKGRGHSGTKGTPHNDHR